MENAGLQNGVASQKGFDKLLSRQCPEKYPGECCALETACLMDFASRILMCDFIYMSHLLLE